MKESYGEGVEITGPESCGGDSNITAEALIGVHSEQVLSREILFNFGVPTLWDNVEGNIGYITIARYVRTLRGGCRVTGIPTAIHYILNDSNIGE